MGCLLDIFNLAGSAPSHFLCLRIGARGRELGIGALSLNAEAGRQAFNVEALAEVFGRSIGGSEGGTGA